MHKKFKKSKEVDKLPLANFVVEEFRFLKSYYSLMNKVQSIDLTKYWSTYNFHVNRIKELMMENGLNIVELEGKTYDEGLPITPLNIEDFEKDEPLIIEQVIEPLIISVADGAIIKSGTVMLAKQNKNEGE